MTRTIFLITGRLCVGGAEKTLVDLANGLDKNDYSVTVCTLSEPNPLSESLTDGVRHMSLGHYTKFNPRTHIRLLRLINQEKPSIIQSFLPLDNAICRLCYLLFPDITVITGLRSLPNNPNPIYKKLDQISLELSDCIVSNSEAGREHLISNGCIPEQVRVIHNGRRIDKYHVDYEKKDQSLDSVLNCHAATDGPVVGTVGRLIKRKGHYDLLEAWPEITNQCPSAELLIAGDGPEKTGLQKQASKMGCSDSIHFLGTRNDVPKVLSVIDIFVFPSHFEGLPGALLEAMAAELPIVCTPVDGNSELVIDGHSGLHVEPHNPDQLREKILQLIENEPLAQRLSSNAYNRARNNFSLEKMVENFDLLYTELLEK